MSVNTFAIIVTYNGMPWLAKCIGSTLQSSIPVNIIIVDNGSSDGTVEYINQHFKKVTFIKSDKNIGFGQANNIGIKKAYDLDADFVFLLNQDAWIEKDTIEKLVCIHEKNPGFGVISPLHLNDGATALDVGFSNYIIPAMCPGLVSDAMLSDVKDQLYETSFVNAAAWLLSKKCIQTVGGFNPVFFHYGEDDNYVHRVLYHGFKVGIYPLARIFHDRENRQCENVNQNNEREKRNILLKYSDPNSTETLEDLIRTNRKHFVRSLFFLKLNSAKYYKELIKKLKFFNLDLTENLKKSRIAGVTFLETGKY